MILDWRWYFNGVENLKAKYDELRFSTIEFGDDVYEAYYEIFDIFGKKIQ